MDKYAYAKKVENNELYGGTVYELYVGEKGRIAVLSGLFISPEAAKQHAKDWFKVKEEDFTIEPE